MINLSKIDLNSDQVAFVEAKPAGWTGDLPVKQLLEALETNKVPKEVWPSPPSDLRCLERALNSLRERRALVRPLKNNRGFSVVLENPDDLDLEKMGNSGESAHKVEFTVKIERAEQDGAVSTLRVTPDQHPAIPLIRQEFARYRGDGDGEGLFKCSQDLSHWFSQVIIPWCSGVATRSRGGTYYVMKGKYLDRLVSVSNALDAASQTTVSEITIGTEKVSIMKVLQGGRIILKPELASVAAVEILIDNLIEEVTKTCEKLDERVDTGKLGTKGLETQKNIAEEAMLKLKEYEVMLGTSLLDVKKNLETVTEKITLTELQLLGAEDIDGAFTVKV